MKETTEKSLFRTENCLLFDNDWIYVANWIFFAHLEVM